MFELNNNIDNDEEKTKNGKWENMHAATMLIY